MERGEEGVQGEGGLAEGVGVECGVGGRFFEIELGVEVVGGGERG